VGLDILREVPRSHSDTPHTVKLFWTKIGLSQKSLFDQTQHSQETEFYATRGIQTHNSSKRVAVEPRLRLCSYWDLLLFANGKHLKCKRKKKSEIN